MNNNHKTRTLHSEGRTWVVVGDLSPWVWQGGIGPAAKDARVRRGFQPSLKVFLANNIRPQDRATKSVRRHEPSASGNRRELMRVVALEAVGDVLNYIRHREAGRTYQERWSALPDAA